MLVPLLLGLTTLGWLSALAMMVLRQSWANSRTAKAPGGGWWTLAVVAWLAWSFALASGLKAMNKGATYEALNSLPVVDASELLSREDLLGTPLVIQGRAFCLEKPQPGQNEPMALAVRSVYSGQEEKEGEENDYVDVENYGSEQDVSRFAFLNPTGPLQIDTDAFQVVANAAPEHSTIQTNEYSAVTGGYLEEYTDRRVIPCESDVSVTGAFVKEGGTYQFEPLKRELSILTDRPWPQLLLTAGTQSRRSFSTFVICLALALGAGLFQLFGVMQARSKA